MKTYKHILSALIIFLIALAIPLLANKYDLVYFLLLIPVTIFLFHLVARNNIFFKPYFLSKWNFLTSKFSNDITVDIPRELMFDKLLEVIASSPFKLRYANKEEFRLLVTSKMSWLSWGETIYIDLKGSNGQIIIHFDSVAFQAFDWGKNERNYETFIQNLEDSLTV